MKFLKPTTFLITIILLASIVIGCDNASVKTEELESINKEKPVEEVKGIAEEEIAKENKQEILVENIKTQSSIGQKNTAPKIFVTEPDNGEIITADSFEIWWKAEDPNDDKLLIQLEYRKGGSWVLISDNEVNDRSFLWDLGTLSNGDYQLRATVTDGRLSAYSTKRFEIKR